VEAAVALACRFRTGPFAPGAGADTRHGPNRRRVEGRSVREAVVVGRWVRQIGFGTRIRVGVFAATFSGVTNVISVVTAAQVRTAFRRPVRASAVVVLGLVAGLVAGVFPLIEPGRAVAAVDRVAAEANTSTHDAHDDHGHHTEIGHNPPHGMALKDFESPAEFRSDLAIWSLAVFLLLLGLLGKFAWKPIMEGLDKREQGIEHQIAETKAANAEAKQMLASYERRLSEAADEVRGMLEEARRDSESTKQSIIAEARKAAEDEQARAKHEIGLARDEALSSIAEKAGDLAVEVAGKFLREKIGNEDHSRLIRDSVASLGAIHGTKPSVN